MVAFRLFCEDRCWSFITEGISSTTKCYISARFLRCHCGDRVLLQNPVVINEFFVQRTEAWFRIVIQDGLGFSDFWYRFEFAKSRGAIHFHALNFDKNKSKAIHSILNTARDMFRPILVQPYFSSEAPTDDAINSLHRQAAADYAASLPDYVSPISAEHPAGRFAVPTPGVEYPVDVHGQPILTSWVQHRPAAAGAPGYPEPTAKDLQMVTGGVATFITRK